MLHLKHLGNILVLDLNSFLRKICIQRLLCTGQVKDGYWENIACLMPLRKDRSGLRNRNLRTARTGVKLGQLEKVGVSWPWMREENFFKKTLSSPSPEWDHLHISWTSGKTVLLSHIYTWGLVWNSVWLCLSHLLLNHSSHGSCSSLPKILTGGSLWFQKQLLLRYSQCRDKYSVIVALLPHNRHSIHHRSLSPLVSFH